MSSENKLPLPEPDLGYIETDKSRQPAFSARQMREALAQQAQEPVALGVPIHNLRTMANGLRAVDVVNKRFIAARLDEIADYLRDLEQATPQPQPAPPVPAPVDERAAFKAELARMPEWEPDFKHHRAWVEPLLWAFWQARAALSKPAPLAGEVTREQMVAAVRPLCNTDAVAEKLVDVSMDEYRAILALRPQAVPMTPGQVIALANRVLPGWSRKDNDLAYLEVVRAVEAHHGITAKAEGGCVMPKKPSRAERGG